ncbi:hypothetical protein, partial [Escherichia coli]|uniref:hypothetical protein n=1 Tax=Escherichia coli TaxID=562 RepID=UPI0021CABE22
SIKNDGHYFCRAGGNRPDGLNEPVTAFLLLTNHPGLHMPQAATSWASCLFVVSLGYIMYLIGTLSSIKKPAEAGS